MLDFETQYYSSDIHAIAGCDEAGRGPLAGPVFAAAVIFPEGYQNEEINDSKKLSASKRKKLFEIIERDALSYGIASVDAETIDKINIYEASRLAMKLALSQLKVPYQLVVSDAMPINDLPVKVIPIIKGDAKCLNIAAASILAKTMRDEYMEELALAYPQYSFASHKGYGTKAHLDELEKYGPIEGIHRKSFGPVAKFYQTQLKLF